jgi:hypothetical protein
MEPTAKDRLPMPHAGSVVPAASRRALVDAAGGVLLAVLPVAVFWRGDFFFLFDDWTELAAITQSGFVTYIVSPNSEIWFPLFRTVFYGLVHAVGANYGVYIAVNCLMLGVNAVVFARLLRRAVPPWMALILAVVYVISPANAVIAWNAFYLCYLLCLLFFLMAWLRTAAFLDAPGGGRLTGVALCGLASVLCHPATLLALPVLPLYAWIADPGALRQKALPTALAVGAGMAVYIVLYVSFADAGLLSILSPGNDAAFSMGGYLLHCLYGAFLSPFIQLYFRLDQAMVRFYFLSATGGVAVLLLIAMLSGTPRERAQGTCAVMANILIFALVSLGRHQLLPAQALSPRYGFFSAAGLLLLFGAFWSILLRTGKNRFFAIMLPLGFLGLLSMQTTTAFTALDSQYLHWSRASRLAYYGYEASAGRYTAQEATAALLYPQLRVFTQGQAARLRLLLGD